MIGVLLLVANWHDLRKTARAKAVGRVAAPVRTNAREAEVASV
jgi:hypothetical protein